MTKTEEQVGSERVVAGVFVSYYTTKPDQDGVDRPVLLTANRGETIVISEAEGDRLDALGMLEEPGRDGDKDREQRLERYRAARGDKSSAELVMDRALAPDPVIAPNTGPISVAPTGGGAAPYGDFITGDTGGPDVEPAPQVGLGDGGIVRADAPDVAAASVSDLADWITEEKPNVDDTVALAEGDANLAAKVLEAEGVATGGDPRAGVEKRLTKLQEG